MGQKVNRVIRACVELQEKNPIISIHDQGAGKFGCAKQFSLLVHTEREFAGGNGNVLKEIVEPEGARIEIRKILVLSSLPLNVRVSF